MKSRDIVEKVNDATVTPGFYAEKPIMGGRYIIKARAKEVEGMSPALLVSVHDPRNPHRGSGFLEREGMGGIASFRFIARPDGYMYSSSSGVDPRYQRQGIATEVYRFVRGLGNSVKPSKLQTDQGRAMWQAWQERGIMEATQGVQLQGLGRFFQGQDPMVEFVPERGTHSYALHPDNWERTFYSLTLKDPEKIRFYRPRDVDLPAGTLVADMFWANRFHRAKTDAERQHAVGQYRRSMVPVDQANISKYRMPELLIPPGVTEAPRLNEKWSKSYKQSIDCNDPKGFSQKAHCSGRKARQAGRSTKSSSITEAQGQPRVYLDMDGVLADFFAEWARLAGVDSGSYRDIPPARVDPTLDKMVGTDFFRRLPKFATTDALIRMIVQEFGGYSICSSPLRGDHENSARNKRLWIRKNLDPQPQSMEFTGRKEQHARQPDGTPNILIDDRGSNITKWEAAGGIGIKYQADEDGLDVIRQGIKRARDIMAGRRPLEPQQLVSRDRSQIMSTGDDRKTQS